MNGLEYSTSERSRVAVESGLLSDIPASGNDIKKTFLTGQVALKQSFHGNFVECRLDEAVFSQTNLSRCDWKDCRITNSEFLSCDFAQASIITNYFENCRFVECVFPDTDINDGRFSNCEFISCDFTSVIFKSGNFEETQFDRCLTSNRVIESSLLINTSWRGMEIDVRLVTGNFGLKSVQLIDCRLVERDSGGIFYYENLEEVLAAFSKRGLSSLEDLRVRYFAVGRLDADAGILDDALNIRNWGSDAVVEASLATQLNIFSQFLMILFENDEIAFYPILILHTRNFEVLTWLEGRPRTTVLYQVVAGVHWTLSREVETFMRLVDFFSGTLDVLPELHFAARGPVDPVFFQRWFAEVGVDGIKVLAVKPRNSPVDLAVVAENYPSLVALIALFLASRLKVELSELSPKSNGQSVQRESGDNQVFAVSAGFVPAKTAEYELSVRTLLPKSLLLDLRITLNVSLFTKARGVLVQLLTSSNEPSTPSDAQAPQKES